MSIDAQEFLKDLHVLESDLRKETYHAVQEALREAERAAKATSLFEDRTGALRNSIKAFETSSTSGELIANTPYARFVENGTVRHTIVGKPFLSFEWKGVPVTFRWVDHPGTAPRPFMQRAGDWGGKVLYDALDAYTSSAIRSFNSR